MCKKLIYLIPFMLVLGLVSSASADLAAHWSFDNDETDSVGSLNWTLNGGATYSTDAQEGSHSLQLDGVDGYAGQASTSILNDAFSTETVLMWFKADTTSGTQVLYDEGGTTRGLSIRIDNGNLEAAIRDASTQVTVSTSFSITDWSHVAITFDNGLFKLYLNGAEQDSIMAGFTIATAHSNAAGIGARNAQDAFGNSSTGDYFGGLIDDVQVYDNALSASDIAALAGGYPKSYNPAPVDGSLYADTWANLAWTSGTFSVSHDLYLGENFDDVNSGAEGTFQGNQAGTDFIIGFPGFAYPDGLVPGATYYWRVDEVNDAEPNSPWKGDVWSFWIPPRTAYAPDPADGVKFVYPDVILNWTAGFSARLHHVYFGDNFEDVNNATVGLPIADAIYTPGALELDKVYYWRVDEFDGVATLKGNVWSFRTLPDIPITDPDLLCWWTLDEGSGRNILDWSGHGHDGTIRGDPQWVEGYHGGALKFNGVNDDVIHQLPQAENIDNFTVALWARADALGQGQFMSPFSSHTPNSSGFQLDVDGSYPGYYRSNTAEAPGPAFGPVILEWVHLALVAEGTTLQYYYNGMLANSYTYSTDELLFNEFIIGSSRNNVNYFDGAVDDLRVYTKALTQDEIQLVIRGDLLLSWNASPANGSVPNLRDAAALSWSPGDNASGHDVYFGTNKDAVENADTSTAEIYRGRQGSTSYTPPEGVEWGGGPYYWRIDEYNTDETISKGRVWTFMVADFIGIDDFEDYDVGNNEIWWAWIDGLGYASHPTLPAHPGNGTGSMVGDETTGSYMEETIVHRGSKSMPVFYDNNQQGVFRYSEVEKTLTYPRDWTEEGVGVLSLWFYGDVANAAESLYVALNGSAVVTHDNPNAAQLDQWTEWTIDLQEFADQGVNLANVNTIAIGLGNKNNPVAGGSGMMYFDDIRLLRPLPEREPEPAP